MSNRTIRCIAIQKFHAKSFVLTNCCNCNWSPATRSAALKTWKHKLRAHRSWGDWPWSAHSFSLHIRSTQWLAVGQSFLPRWPWILYFWNLGRWKLSSRAFSRPSKLHLMHVTLNWITINKNNKQAYIELFYNDASRRRNLCDSYISTSSRVKSLSESFTGAIIPFANAAGVFFC